MTHSCILRRFSAALLLASLLVAWSAQAATTIKIAVDPGVTEFEIAGHEIRIETTARVTVRIEVQGDTIRGSVTSVPGEEPAELTITVLGPPDQVIFEGRVYDQKDFLRYVPKETGQGEM